jgi:hypothetical protein
LGLWLLLIAAFIAYVAADAAFDASDKISRFWRLRALPVLRSVWGAVAGVAPRAAPAAPRAHDDSRGRANSAASVDNQGPLGDFLQSRGRVVHWGEILAFLWKAKWLILILSIFVVVTGTLRGCSPPWGKSRDTLQAELKNARADTDVARFETKLANRATELADDTNRDRSRRERVIAEAEQEITDAVEASDFDRLYDAYERGTRGLWLEFEPADSSDSAPAGIAPVRRPGAHAA